MSSSFQSHKLLISQLGLELINISDHHMRHWIHRISEQQRLKRALACAQCPQNIRYVHVKIIDSEVDKAEC